MNKICVIGLGYIGLPTALLMSKAGFEVVGFDTDIKKVNNLIQGKLYFNEPGLPKLFRQASKKKISFTNKIENADAYVIAVPTPQSEGYADLKYVFSALESIRSVFSEGNLIIVESTIGPRDCVEKIIPKIRKWNKKFYFSHCPERAIPGKTLNEMVQNERIIGGIDKKSQAITEKIYQKFVTSNIHLTDPTTAAACKVMENTYRAVNIALANEFAILANRIGFNVWDAIELANKHPRVNIHQPGPGVGGHCIPIDPWFFVSEGRAILTKTSLELNESMKNYVSQKFITLARKHHLTKKSKVAILGYAYKKNIDDARETPAQGIINLLSKHFRLLITDEYILEKDFVSLDQALGQSQAIILLTDHDQYKAIDFKTYPNIEFVLDTRNVLNLNKNFKDSAIVLYKL